MKRSILIGIGLLCLIVIAAIWLIHIYKTPTVTIAVKPSGLQSLKCDKVEFLGNGEFRVEQVLLMKPGGETYPGSTHSTSEFDQQHQTVTKTFPWGKVKIGYASLKNILTLTIMTTNTSDTDTIQSVRYVPIDLRFPEKLKEYDGSDPLLAHNIGWVAGVKVSYGSGTLAIVSEDIDKPLIVGLPWALNRPTSTEYPLSVHTGRVSSYPDSLPTVHRPIGPKSSDTFVITLRFGRPNATELQLEGDKYKKFAEIYPSQLKWTDHRPIGAIILAAASQNWAANPRGWFNDVNTNVMTPTGRSEFQKQLINTADSSINIMRDMNAQGAVTWDPEGQEFTQASYIGDPRLIATLAPEMEPAIDEYFDRFHKAGLRVGMCFRPQLLRLAPDKKSATQEPVDNPAQVLIDKISYAKKRWGVTLIYIGANVNPKDPNPLDAGIIQKVANTFPDCLVIPEFSTLRYYAYSVPFKELRQGNVSTPDLVRQVYPGAFSLIYTADGPLDLYHASLAAAVKRGDSMMYRTWYPDPQNEKVKSLYSK